jgi:hypothetical protein
MSGHRARQVCNVIPAKAGTHATVVLRSEACMGAGLRGHDVT